MSPTHITPSYDERQPLLSTSTAATVSDDGTTTTSESATVASASDAQSLARLSASLLVDSIPGERCTLHRATEVWGIISLFCFSVILSYALQNSIQTSSILVVGRLGPDELSAAAFSLMFAMVTG